MLERLSIKNLGLITDAELTLGKGLVVITGETGAGKTLFLDAIRSLAGSKPEMVNAIQGESASVEAILSVTSQMQETLDDADAMVDEGGISITRTFPREGRSKSILGGRAVPAGLLEKFSQHWLAIHGQHDSYRLMKIQSHRELLDRFAAKELSPALSKHRHAFQAWNGLRQQLLQVTKERAALMKDAESIKADLALCDSLSLQLGEDIELAATIDRLGRVEQVRTAVSIALEALTSDETNIPGALAQAEKAIAQALPGDSQAQGVVQRLNLFKNELNDLVSEITSINDSLDVDPEKLDALMLRQRQIKSLILRHGPSLEDVLQWMDQARVKLALIDPDGKALRELEKQVESALREATQSAEHVSGIRKAFASQLSQRVQTELKSLALPHARFETTVEPSELTELGADRVEFKFSANPGLPLQSIEKAASGGELSRLILAIEVALSDVSPPSVMVFDEVDAGVAGAAAIAVAERLATLAQHSQVLVVTHLAQIAAFAQQHFTVTKTSDGSISSTEIAEIQGVQRENELARMLAGLEESASARTHARELIQMAESAR
jgi:DNA repair protein RecN (Recombination protein N)